MCRLSQTPIRILLALRLSDERSSIKFLPSPSTSLPPNSFCIVESAPLPQCPTPPPETDGKRGFQSNELVGTPSSERSEGSFFASLSRASSSRESIKANSLPSVGSFVGNRQAYVAAILEELEGCVARSSLTKVKLFAGSQLFRSGGSQSPEPGERVSMEEASRWKVCSLYSSIMRVGADEACRLTEPGGTSRPSSRSPFRWRRRRRSRLAWSTGWGSSCRTRRRMCTSFISTATELSTPSPRPNSACVSSPPTVLPLLKLICLAGWRAT